MKDAVYPVLAAVPALRRISGRSKEEDVVTLKRASVEHFCKNTSVLVIACSSHVNQGQFKCSETYKLLILTFF